MKTYLSALFTISVLFFKAPDALAGPSQAKEILALVDQATLRLLGKSTLVPKSKKAKALEKEILSILDKMAAKNEPYALFQEKLCSKGAGGKSTLRSKKGVLCKSVLYRSLASLFCATDKGFKKSKCFEKMKKNFIPEAQAMENIQLIQKKDLISPVTLKNIQNVIALKDAKKSKKDIEAVAKDFYKQVANVKTTHDLKPICEAFKDNADLCEHPLPGTMLEVMCRRIVFHEDFVLSPCQKAAIKFDRPIPTCLEKTDRKSINDWSSEFFGEKLLILRRIAMQCLSEELGKETSTPPFALKAIDNLKYLTRYSDLPENPLSQDAYDVNYFIAQSPQKQHAQLMCASPTTEISTTFQSNEGALCQSTIYRSIASTLCDGFPGFNQSKCAKYGLIGLELAKSILSQYKYKFYNKISAGN